ncbi:agmatinase [Pseudodonghicola flavimaris]|uniref:Agmatinase n=1 Tax=Pseudodonghicola flavimaris TaxID=3050036 RepID=A0ABT7EX71_9RHOB|nr:agmatinase [Pseudodonghicola flavimaris]MDK3016880.1 agmatinase [Pseudodonghicola flavimaris]
MDKERLAALRAQFGAQNSTRIYDPKFARVGQKLFNPAGTRAMPWSGVPTLLDAPHRPDGSAEGLQIALTGLPMDLGITNRPGTRFGPRAMRAIERIGPYEHVLDCLPLHEARVADIGDVAFTGRYDLEQSHRDIEAHIDRILAAGALPLSVGGDHSVTHPILRALGRDRPVGLIHIDAHCDTGGSTDGTRFHHGGPMRNAVLDGVLDPERTIQIGIRGSSEYLWEFSTVSGMSVIHAEEVPHLGMVEIIRRARAVVGDGPTYLSFDIDAVDPGFAPGTGTPEVGGLTPREVLELLRGLKGLNLIGADVVEVSPEYDATTNTAHVAAQVMFTILSLMTFSPSLPA